MYLNSLAGTYYDTPGHTGGPFAMASSAAYLESYVLTADWNVSYLGITLRAGTLIVGFNDGSTY